MTRLTPLPTLRQLQFFLALTRRRSFSKAADDCLVSQSTLSTAVKELELILQRQLVDRSGRAFALTPSGEEAAQRAAPILALAEDLVRAMTERRPLEGPFMLGVIPTIAPFLLPGAAGALRQRFPKLELFLREDLTDALLERLGAGLIDAALLALPYDLPGLEVVDIGEDRFWFAARADHPLADKSEVATGDLAEARLILLEDGHCMRQHALDACRLKDAEASAAFGATSLLTLTQMVQAGLGATLLPKLAVDAGLAAAVGLKVAPLASTSPARRIGLVWRKGSGRNDDCGLLAAVFRERMAASGSRPA